MTKSFAINAPALDITAVGFGQAGSRIVDVFAKYTTAEGVQAYNCLALNSNDGDLKELKFIDPANRISLNLGGLGKNPEKAIKILDHDEKVQAKMHNFISKKLGAKNDLVLFVAGLGGGTGTSTIVKAIEDFHKEHNAPKITTVLEAMVTKLGKEAYEANKAEFHKRALKIAEENFIKLGVIACLPLRNDGPDVLRQVNAFATRIWGLANDVTKSVSFVMFPDNQFFYDTFKGLPQTEKERFDNYRDYVNYEIASTIHEINTAAVQGGTKVTLDKEDFKRLLTENKGCLVLSKQELPSSSVEDVADVTALFEKAISTSNMHDPVQLQKDDAVAKVHHVGFLAAIDSGVDYGSSFIETTTEHLHEALTINGSVFPGYVQEKNEGMVTAYVFYKADVLPGRLAKGLVKEYKEFTERNQKAKYADSTIEKIDAPTDELDGLSLDDLGIELFAEDKPKKEEAPKEDIKAALKDFDFSF